MVAGGAGYIGSHTVRQLQKNGYSVVVVDNLSRGYRAALPKEIAFYQVDIGNTEEIAAICQKEQVEAALHFAALIEVGISQKEPFSFYDNNVKQTLGLLDGLQKAGVGKLIFSSTAAVYGVAQAKPLSEDAPKAPASVYGRTKYMVEQILEDLDMVGAMRYVALRYFNAAGADPVGDIGESHRPETHLIPLILQVALGQRASISIFGDDYPTPDGTCIRDYVHVNDLADAHIAALQYLEDGGKSDVFNVGSGSGYSVKEVIECCREVTGHPIPVEYAPRREGDVPVLLADTSHIQKVFNCPPQHDLRHIVETAWIWHKTHPHGF
ncbi:MAG: UDP-glucose 4-epimerase GalE [Myxococcales bacterium]|nr:UDP-glucose 4-epimerase GalE [Myxococcales bacterium]MCB9641848.1 UDP-glucose 4-epimerase GalE [Myxococcales bacterium]